MFAPRRVDEETPVNVNPISVELKLKASAAELKLVQEV